MGSIPQKNESSQKVMGSIPQQSSWFVCKGFLPQLLSAADNLTLTKYVWPFQQRFQGPRPGARWWQFSHMPQYSVFLHTGCLICMFSKVKLNYYNYSRSGSRVSQYVYRHTALRSWQGILGTFCLEFAGSYCVRVTLGNLGAQVFTGIVQIPAGQFDGRRCIAL